MDFIGGRGDFTFPFTPKICDLLKQLQKTWPAMRGLRRKISAAKKRLQIRREKNIQRPAATASRGLHERHVNLVHVRALLAVRLDADEMFVQIRADFFVLETFAFHDVAPVAGRVADAQEDRLFSRRAWQTPRRSTRTSPRDCARAGADTAIFLRETVGVFGGHETGLTEFCRIKNGKKI